MTAPAHPQAARAALMRDTNFRWLLGGGIVSMLGDQFTLIALPWLVLRMSGDSAAVGTVFALLGVPRALFILVGGAVVDRHSPKQVLMVTKYVNSVLLGALAALVLGDAITLPVVYLLALVLGLSTAFSIPSGTSLFPMAVKPEQLHAANSIMLGLRQLSMFLGPVLAGLLIALFGHGGGTVTDSLGLGCAFLFDALTFAGTIWTLAKVQVHWQAPAASTSAPRGHVLRSVVEGLRHCWNDVSLRSCFLYWGAIAFFIQGPVQVAVPVLAAHLQNNASGYGALLGAHGAGTLAGMVVSGMRPGQRARRLGLTILVADAIVALLFMPLGLIGAVWQGVLLMLLIGSMAGYVQVSIFTWMQRRVPPQMMGRTMSLFMFIFMGVAPVSAALAGWLMRSVTPAQLFTGCGAVLLMIVALALLLTPMRGITDAPPATSPG